MHFKDSILAHQTAFGVTLGNETIDRLGKYYDLVMEHNQLLHLVAPCDAEEFAIRHVLESLTLLEHLAPGASFADIGPGGGFPSMPCLIARDDLRSVLIEAKLKKSDFLRSSASEIGTSDRTEIINRQFEEIQIPDVDLVTCRALDKFSEKLLRLIRWSRDRTIVLFAGPRIETELVKIGTAFEKTLLPLSDQRYLFKIRGRR